MPKMSRDEVKELVDKGEILAITMDTSIFDKFGCNLMYKSLTAVEQFKEKHIDFLLSPVTAGEVQSHISKSISEAATKAKAGINQFLKATHSSVDLISTLSVLGIDADPAYQAKEMFVAYVKRVGASIITHQVSSDDLLELYFDASPPFGRNSEKKSEFPDAIALLALELWAAENDTLLIAVSRDGDWQSFAETSERIICLQELPIVLALFNDQESVIAARVASAIKTGTAFSLGKVIEAKLENYIEYFDIDASSAFNYDYEIGGATIINWDYKNNDEISVVASSDDQVVISFDVAAEADFYASFDFSVRDSIDRDYVNLGSSTASIRQTFNVTVVATFDKSNDRDPEPFELEIEGRGIIVDFGSVDPDWD